MMDIPQKAIEALKELYRKHEGKELADADVRDIADNLLTIWDLVYKPIPKKLLEEQKEEFPELYAFFKKRGKLPLSEREKFNLQDFLARLSNTR